MSSTAESVDAVMNELRGKFRIPSTIGSNSLREQGWTEETEESEETEELEEAEEREETKEKDETKASKETQEIEEEREAIDGRGGIQRIDLHQLIINGDQRAQRELKGAIEFCVLTTSKTSNVSLFNLCRRVKGIEHRYDIQLSAEDLRKLFDVWETLSRPFLREDHDYFTEFLVKLTCVREPWGERLAEPLSRAYQATPPPQVLVITDTDAHILACLCRELQRIAGNDPFYLTSRAVAQLLGHPHSTIAGWLKAFPALRIIKVIEQGQPGRASRYRYVLDDLSL